MDSDMKKIKEALIKHNINNSQINKFFAHCESHQFDFIAIQIDLEDADPTQSSLYEYITKELNNIKIYQIIKSVVDPSYNISTNNKPKDEKKTTLIENKQNDINIKEQPSQPQLLITNADIDKIRTNHRLSLQIVDGSLVDIPDNIPYKYYENIDGITYLLNHNKELIDNQDYNHMFWSFWEEFINDEPTFSNISNDLQNKEGQIIICINDHPPSERALPILERIVYELQLKRLKSNNKKIKKSKIDSYKQNAITFYKQHLPQYKMDENVINASVLCKLNEHKSNLIDIQFELFTVLIDIWDIMSIYNKNIQLKNDIHSMFYCEEKNEKHYGFQLNKQDANELCDAILNIKHNKQSIYKSLKSVKYEINDNLRIYQLICLGFISFIKCFICSMEEGLNVYNHIKICKKKKKKQKEIVLDFNNDNFPLQFDLVILSKNRKQKHKYFFDENVIEKNCLFYVGIEDIMNDKCIDDIYKYIQHIKDKMVKTFHYILLKETEHNVAQNGKDKKQGRNKKCNDRYVIVVNRKNNKLYLYAPFINNGLNGKIKHRKKIISVNEEKKSNDGLIENKFSFIGYDANDLTNFYLTSKCLIMSSINKNINMNKMDIYGVNDFEFVFSAHFHAQKDWYKHPKLKLYQYFNGGGLRFFKQHIIDIWKRYFIDNGNGLSDDDINKLFLFDDILDLEKCDEIYRKWYRDIKRFFTIK